MFETIKKLFGFEEGPDLAAVLKSGAVVIDVRSRGEYASGHLENAINIPLNELQNNIGKLDRNKPIITCCASGMRSGSAKTTLLSKGFKEVYNGGGWQGLKKYMQ